MHFILGNKIISLAIADILTTFRKYSIIINYLLLNFQYNRTLMCLPIDPLISRVNIELSDRGRQIW